MRSSALTAAVMLALLLASASVRTQSLVFHVPGPSSIAAFGSVVRGAGDVNGDGVVDFLVGAPSDNTNGAYSGSVWFFSGHDGTLLRVVRGGLPGARFGRSADGVGDINGDGRPDAIVAGAGFAQVLSGLDGSVIHFLTDPVSLTIATNVAGVGDLDNDGAGDFATSDPEAMGGRGRVRVWSGANATVRFDITGGTVTSFSGTVYGEKLGSSLAGAGFVDGDATPDFVAGAPERRVCAIGIGGGTCDFVGRIYVYSGATGAILHTWTGIFTSPTTEVLGKCVDGAGDVDGDGRDDVVSGIPGSNKARVFSGATGATLATLAGTGSGGPFGIEFFGSSVAGAGDVNGDGFADVIVGAPGCSIPLLCPSPGYIRGFAGLTAGVLFTLIGAAAADGFGTSVDGAGDIDGDGFADFLAGGTILSRVYTGRTLTAASTAPTGSGCWIPSLIPNLTVTSPVMGGSVSIVVSSAPVPSFGWLGVSLPAAPTMIPGGPFLSSACHVWVDLSAYVVLAVFVPDGSGTWSLPGLSLPSIPTQAGTTVVLQAALFPPGGGLAFTNGVLATYGC